MADTSHRYFVLHKPRNMVSQFVSSHVVNLLTSIDFPFPEGTHAIGRLDSASEGLLLLTTDKKITKKLFQGTEPHERKYLVQVKHQVTEETLEKLRRGVSIQVKGGGFYTTIPCSVELVDDPSQYVEVNEPPQHQAPSSWIMMSLVEGKFHQVRKMVDAVGHRCKRLIRVSIEEIVLAGLKPGEVREMNEKDFYEKLHLQV